MLTQSVQRPLTKQEVKEVVKFVSYHLNYVPLTEFNVEFVKSAKEYADWYEGYKVRTPEHIDEINKDIPCFFDQTTNTAVMQAFNYIDGIVVPVFVYPMATIVHECIHFFQYATSTSVGTWKVMYEGTNEVLSCFLMNDDVFDYEKEAQYAFNLIMELCAHDFMDAIIWMKRYTVHSNKNGFVERSIKQCPTFSKFRPRNLLRWLDNNQLGRIKNDAARAIFTKYGMYQIKQMIHANHELIMRV